MTGQGAEQPRPDEVRAGDQATSPWAPAIGRARPGPPQQAVTGPEASPAGPEAQRRTGTPTEYPAARQVIAAPVPNPANQAEIGPGRAPLPQQPRPAQSPPPGQAAPQPAPPPVTAAGQGSAPPAATAPARD